MSNLFDTHRAFLPAWVSYAAAVVAVGLMDMLIGLILSQMQVDGLSILHITVVLVAAVAFGGGPAVLASVVAFLTYDWFFVEPLHSFTVAHPGSWVSLFTFLLTAIVTGHLAAGQRERARQAGQREREALILADVVQSMSSQPLDQSLKMVAERLRKELSLLAVSIEIADRDRSVQALAGEPTAFRSTDSSASTMVLTSSPDPSDSSSSSQGTWVRVIPPALRGGRGSRTQAHRYSVAVKVQGRHAGVLQVARWAGDREFDAAENRLLSVVAAQLGLVVERLRLRRDSMEAELLRRTDALKTSLLNAVSHDLRTPLVSVMAAAGSLLEEDVEWTRGERRQFAESIEKEAGRLNRLVGNLLDLSRIETGKLRIRKEWQDLGVLVEDVLDRLRLLTARHRVTACIPEDLPSVPLDYVQIDQVLSNLIDNSVKYSPEGTEIRISARLEGDGVQVEVANQGPAIPEEAVAHIFEPFYRVENDRRQPNGTGLGLAVAKALVEAHGGAIWAISGPDGTSFFFRLPLWWEDSPDNQGGQDQ